MTSKVDIANIALRRIGTKKRLLSIDEQSEVGALIELVWDHVLGLAHEQLDWSFARTRVALDLDSLDPPPEWQFSYLRPLDCLVPRAIEDGLKQRRVEERIPYKPGVNTNGTQVIYTDYADAVLIYTRLVTDENQWSFHFADYFAWVLASEVALSESLSEEIRSRAYTGREWSYGRAWEVEHSSEQWPAPRVSEWHEAR